MSADKRPARRQEKVNLYRTSLKPVSHPTLYCRSDKIDMFMTLPYNSVIQRYTAYSVHRELLTASE